MLVPLTRTCLLQAFQQVAGVSRESVIPLPVDIRGTAQKISQLSPRPSLRRSYRHQPFAWAAGDGDRDLLGRFDPAHQVRGAPAKVAQSDRTYSVMSAPALPPDTPRGGADAPHAPMPKPTVRQESEPARGLEPLTTCLQDKCAASCATPAGNRAPAYLARRCQNGSEAIASGPFLVDDVRSSAVSDHAGRRRTWPT